MRDLLDSCTVKILSSSKQLKGTGFFIAKGLILTCAHVVKDFKDSDEIDISWRNGNPSTFKTQIREIICRDNRQLSDDPSQDIAILNLIDDFAHPCVEFDLSTPQLNTELLVYGHSEQIDGETTFKYEGRGFRKDALLHTLKDGQAVGGMSGSPLFNRSTEKICGFLVISRSLNNNLGARAIPASIIKARFPIFFDLNLAFHRKDKRWSKLRKKPIRRKYSVYLACVCLLLLIFFHFLPPNNNVTIYFIVSIISVLFLMSSLLFTNNLEQELEVGKIELNAVTSIVSLGFCISISMLFINVPFGGDGYTREGKISFQYFTGMDNLPVLSFVESNFPEELTKTVLNTSSNPIVYRKTPAFLALESFVSGSGNNSFIKNTSDAGFSYALNRDGYTRSGGKRGASDNINPSGERRQSESREEFDNSKMTYGEELSTGFKYISLLSQFQANLTNAKWTSFIDSYSKIKEGVGLIIQYPQMSTMLEDNIRDTNKPQWKKDILDDVWLRRIAQENPQHRGIIGFIYSYITDLSNKNIIAGCGFLSSNPDDRIPLVNKSVPTPYVRFADITNSSKSDIRISSIFYKIYGIPDNLYRLTDVTNRLSLFSDIQMTTDSLEPSGIILEPGRHLLIPIEFGLDSGSHKNTFRNLAPVTKEQILTLSKKDLYITRADATIKDYNMKGNLGIVQKFDSSNAFFQESRILDELFESIPKRFAVGSFINLDSITVDSKKLKLNPPLNDTTKLAASKHYMAGSCPYLSVKHKKTKRWEELGTVLYGRSTVNLQDFETHYLGDNIESFRLEEREEEVAYLDSLSVTYFDPISQETYEVELNLPDVMKKVDGQYHLMKQGDSVEINLRKVLPVNAQRIQVKVNGYYLPLANKGANIPRVILNKTSNNQM